jgi:hypothetical protein
MPENIKGKILGNYAYSWMVNEPQKSSRTPQVPPKKPFH